ncbi:hypothetical protein BP6252_06797 [Coleophoma cylindrospora]|uniref:Transcription factor domain-containing protein n=1 Tax=Coleophoma cylindrospora TaxID=1849047 RepID=A0A3D8RG07_9HELO|nr:hypothetical protein BP6252_06797 [Coleophoma cylindrospora]
MERLTTAYDVAASTLWIDHRNILEDLYIIQNKTLAEVKYNMENNHDFPDFPSTRTSIYETRLRDQLGLVKNLKKSDWHSIDHNLKMRDRLGKESIVRHNAKPLDRKRISKARKRYADLPGQAPPLPLYLSIRTPSPVMPEGSQIALTALHHLPCVQSSVPLVLVPGQKRVTTDIDHITPANNGSLSSTGSQLPTVSILPVSPGPVIPQAHPPIIEDDNGLLLNTVRGHSQALTILTRSPSEVVTEVGLSTPLHGHFQHSPQDAPGYTTLVAQNYPDMSLQSRLKFLRMFYSEGLTNLPSFKLYSKLEEIMQPNPIRVAGFIDPSTLSQPSTDSQMIEALIGFKSPGAINKYQSVSQYLALILCQMANGMMPSLNQRELLRHWICQLPLDSIQFFFRINLPIIWPIWSSLVTMLSNRCSKPDPDDVILFKALMEAGFQNGSFIDRRHSAETLALAIHFGCEDILKNLVDYGVELNSSTNGSQCHVIGHTSLLFCATMENRPDTLRFLLRAGVDIKSTSVHETILSDIVRTPSRYGPWFEKECLKILLDAGAVVDLPMELYEERYRPRSYKPSILDAAFFRDRDLFRFLVPYSKNFYSNVTMCGVIDAAEQGAEALDTYLATKLIPRGQSRQWVLESSLVQQLSTCSRPDVVMLLLASGVSLNRPRPWLDFNEPRIDYDEGLPRISWNYPLEMVLKSAAGRGLNDDTFDLISSLMRAGAVFSDHILATSITMLNINELKRMISTIGGISKIGGLALAQVASENDLEAVDLLLSEGVDINSKCSEINEHGPPKLRPLLLYVFLSDCAPGWPSLNTVQYLISRGAVISEPLEWVMLLNSVVLDMRADSVQLLEFLLKLVPSTVVPKYGIYLLARAARRFSERNTESICKLLFEYGVSISSPSVLTAVIQSDARRDFIDWVMCHSTSVNISPAAPELLKKDVNSFPGDYKCSCSEGDSDSDCDNDDEDDGHYDSHYDEDQELGSENCTTSKYNENEEDPLIHLGNLDASDCFLRGHTPLRAAINLADIDLVQRLINHGANLNDPEKFLGLQTFFPNSKLYPCPITTLQMACLAYGWRLYKNDEVYYGKNTSRDQGSNDSSYQEDRFPTAETWLEIVYILLESGAEVNAGSYVTALQLAAEIGSIPLCLLLLGAQASLNASPKSLGNVQSNATNSHLDVGLLDQAYPLDFAAWHGRLDCVRFLLNCGAQSFSQQVTGNGMTRPPRYNKSNPILPPAIANRLIPNKKSTDEYMRVGADHCEDEEDSEPSDCSPALLLPDTLRERPESLSLADAFGYYEQSEFNTMALVRKLVHEDESPDAKDIAVTDEIMVEVRKALSTMLSRQILDFLVRYFVAEVNWIDQLLYPPWFLGQYKKWWSRDKLSSVADIEFTILFLRICCYSLIFLPSPQYTMDSVKGVALADIRSSCEEVINALAPICARLDPRGSLIRVQHIIFAGLGSVCRGRMNSFWETLSCATRVAQKIGLHLDTNNWASGMDALEKEMRRRTFCNLYIWDSCLSKRLDRIPFLPDDLSADMMPRMHLLSNNDIETHAPDVFAERAVRTQLAQFWRRYGLAQGFEYDAIAAEEKYEIFCSTFLPTIPSVFALQQPDKQWDERLPTLPMQRQMLHMAIFEFLCWNFRPVLLQKPDLVKGLPEYKQILILHNKKALAVAALKLLEGVFSLHKMMGGSHTRFAGIIVPIFEAAVPLLCLCADKSFPGDLAEGRSHTMKTDLLGAGISNVTRAECLQAARAALSCLQRLAEISKMAEVGAQTLTRLVGTVESAPSHAQGYGDSSGAADVVIQPSATWSCGPMQEYAMGGCQANFSSSGTGSAEIGPSWEEVLLDFTGNFELDEIGFLEAGQT